MPVPVVAINVDSSVSSAPTNILVADGSHVAAGRWKGRLLPLSEPLSWELMSYRGSRVTRRRWNPGCDGAISITPWALGVRRHLLGGPGMGQDSQMYGGKPPALEGPYGGVGQEILHMAGSHRGPRSVVKRCRPPLPFHSDISSPSKRVSDKSA